MQESFEKLTRGHLVEGYGLTEAAPVVSFNPVDRVKEGTIGIPFPSTGKRFDLLEDALEITTRLGQDSLRVISDLIRSAVR